MPSRKKVNFILAVEKKLTATVPEHDSVAMGEDHRIASANLSSIPCCSKLNS